MIVLKTFYIDVDTDHVSTRYFFCKACGVRINFISILPTMCAECAKDIPPVEGFVDHKTLRVGYHVKGV